MLWRCACAASPHSDSALAEPESLRILGLLQVSWASQLSRWEPHRVTGSSALREGMNSKTSAIML